MRLVDSRLVGGEPNILRFSLLACVCAPPSGGRRRGFSATPLSLLQKISSKVHKQANIERVLLANGVYGSADAREMTPFRFWVLVK